MVKNAQIIRRQFVNCFSMFDHFVKLAHKGLISDITLKLTRFASLSYLLMYFLL